MADRLAPEVHELPGAEVLSPVSTARQLRTTQRAACDLWGQSMGVGIKLSRRGSRREGGRQAGTVGEPVRGGVVTVSILTDRLLLSPWLLVNVTRMQLLASHLLEQRAGS